MTQQSEEIPQSNEPTRRRKRASETPKPPAIPTPSFDDEIDEWLYIYRTDVGGMLHHQTVVRSIFIAAIFALTCVIIRKMPTAIFVLVLVYLALEIAVFMFQCAQVFRWGLWSIFKSGGE